MDSAMAKLPTLSLLFALSLPPINSWGFQWGDWTQPKLVIV